MHHRPSRWWSSSSRFASRTSSRRYSTLPAHLRHSPMRSVFRPARRAPPRARRGRPRHPRGSTSMRSTRPSFHRAVTGSGGRLTGPQRRQQGDVTLGDELVDHDGRRLVEPLSVVDHHQRKPAGSDGGDPARTWAGAATPSWRGGRCEQHRERAERDPDGGSAGDHPHHRPASWFQFPRNRRPRDWSCRRRRVPPAEHLAADCKRAQVSGLTVPPTQRPGRPHRR